MAKHFAISTNDHPAGDRGVLFERLVELAHGVAGVEVNQIADSRIHKGVPLFFGVMVENDEALEKLKTVIGNNGGRVDEVLQIPAGIKFNPRPR